MKLMTCPVNGPRPLQEFHYGGEFREQPDPLTATDDVWVDYVFNHSGEPGIKREWWCHIASGIWFLAERDNQSDEILKTYLFQRTPPHE